MTTPPDADRLAPLERQVRRLRREVRDLVTLMDAMREAWCLPPVVEIRASIRAREIADRLSAARAEDVAPAASDAGPLDAALEAARQEGKRASARGGSAEQCPYGRREAALRHAWLAGLHELQVLARSAAWTEAHAEPRSATG